jgi:hypothetical protein
MNKRLTISAFDELTLKEKGEYIFLKGGRFVAQRTYYSQKLVLYDMGSFFAEVWYEPGINKISKITTLNQDSKEIDHYIDSNM